MSITSADLATALKYEGGVDIKSTSGGTHSSCHVLRVTLDHIQTQHGFIPRAGVASIEFPGLVGRPFGQYLCDKPSPIEGFGNVHETNSLAEIIPLMDERTRVLILLRASDGYVEIATGRIMEVTKESIKLDSEATLRRGRVIGYALPNPS